MCNKLVGLVMLEIDKNKLQAFGKKLSDIRKQANMSQEELAHKSGIDRSYISGIERGNRNVALLNILKLADALEIDVAVLFSKIN